MAGSGDKPTEFIDAVCSEIADRTINAAQDIANSSPVNAGQDTLCAELDIEGQWEGVFSGEGAYIDTGHPEAIGLIVDEINGLLENGAQQCQIARETISWADVF